VLLLAARMSGVLYPATGQRVEGRRIDIHQARLAYQWRPAFRGICHPVYPSAPEFETCPMWGATQNGRNQRLRVTPARCRVSATFRRIMVPAPLWARSL
jgi:hypothetical protein